MQIEAVVLKVAESHGRVLVELAGWRNRQIRISFELFCDGLLDRIQFGTHLILEVNFAPETHGAKLVVTSVKLTPVGGVAAPAV